MRITILGASGKVGQLLVDELLARGHEVTAFIHKKALNTTVSPLLHILSGDINNAKDLEKAVAGSDTVVSTLGSWGTKTKDIVSTATKNIIPVMDAAGIKRFLSVTGGAARAPEDTESFIQKMTRNMLRLVAKPILLDAEEHLHLLYNSDLDWTAIRAPIMTKSASKSYALKSNAPGPFASISRSAVVQALADNVESSAHIKEAPFISRK